MKKLITVLMTLTMVFGVAAMSSAACFNCAGDAGNIKRGCGDQVTCAPFDFEAASYRNDLGVLVNDSYCVGGKMPNRALFKICDCIPEYFETLSAGTAPDYLDADTVDISMEILVDSGEGPDTGDNGVYWAEDVTETGIPMQTYNNQSAACDDDGYDSQFNGPFKYLKADNKTGHPYTGNSCERDLTENDERVVKIVADRKRAEDEGVTTGYTIQPEDDFDDKATWAIDIPELRVDNSKVDGGEKVWVKICVYRYTGGICSENPCCCEIYIGELCCPASTASGNDIVYPYFPPANTTVWNLLGMTITNLDDKAGNAVITMYESDGDVGTLTVNVAAKGIYLNTLGALASEMAKTAGNGTLGDAKCYLVVAPQFTATGFAMIADTIDGASMGYLPISK